MSTKKILSGLTLAALLLGAPLAFAQTTTGTTGAGSTTTTGTTATTPGVPNTGAGGDAAANILLLGLSALVALGGATYLSLKAAQ